MGSASVQEFVPELKISRQTGGGKGVLFFAEGGHWSISQGLGNKLILRSRSEDSSTPPGDRSWEYEDMSGEWRLEPSLSVLPFKHPESIQLEYKGDDQEVKQVFIEETIAGHYLMQNLSKNNAPYYVKQDDPIRYLLRNFEGIWTVTPDLEESVVFLYHNMGIELVSKGDGHWSVTLFGRIGISEEENDTGKMEESNHGAVILWIILLLIIFGIVVSS